MTISSQSITPSLPRARKRTTRDFDDDNDDDNMSDKGNVGHGHEHYRLAKVICHGGRPTRTPLAEIQGNFYNCDILRGTRLTKYSKHKRLSGSLPAQDGPSLRQQQLQSQNRSQKQSSQVARAVPPTLSAAVAVHAHAASECTARPVALNRVRDANRLRASSAPSLCTLSYGSHLIPLTKKKIE
ncbi:hypothetical protein BC828DRAFT_389903 [Blastocladiella britannica]|nr:hypothetical protein BC828DRAFT_389903 [Blastocladiella britannica]